MGNVKRALILNPDGSRIGVSVGNSLFAQRFDTFQIASSIDAMPIDEIRGGSGSSRRYPIDLSVPKLFPDLVRAFDTWIAGEGLDLLVWITDPPCNGNEAERVMPPQAALAMSRLIGAIHIIEAVLVQTRRVRTMSEKQRIISLLGTASPGPSTGARLIYASRSIAYQGLRTRYNSAFRTFEETPTLNAIDVFSAPSTDA